MLLRDGRKLNGLDSRLLWYLRSEVDCLSLCVGLGMEGKTVFFGEVAIDIMIGNKIIYRKRIIWQADGEVKNACIIPK